jgi:hypothetical protein
MGVNIEGAVHALLTDATKIHCEECNGTTFQVSWQLDENTDLPATAATALLWENSTPSGAQGNMQTIVMLCQCGKILGKLAWCIDTCSACATPAVTTTHIAAAAANGLTGLYLTPLGGTDAGSHFTISSNTAADPTVITLSTAINNDTATELILISSFKGF